MTAKCEKKASTQQRLNCKQERVGVMERNEFLTEVVCLYRYCHQRSHLCYQRSCMYHSVTRSPMHVYVPFCHHKSFVRYVYVPFCNQKSYVRVHTILSPEVLCMCMCHFVTRSPTYVYVPFCHQRSYVCVCAILSPEVLFTCMYHSVTRSPLYVYVPFCHQKSYLHVCTIQSV